MINKFIRIIVIILMLFLGLNAIVGSLFLILDPSGETIHIHIRLLKTTPFNNYLIPGIILFISIGMLSLVTSILTIKKIDNYPWFIVLQGCVLIGWLSIQLNLNMEFYSTILHIPLFLIGIMLISFGFIINIIKKGE